MIAERVSFRDFRNIKAASLELSPGVNLLLGRNAQGKTNALEGMYLLAAGKSFRTPRERELVRFGADFFEVRLAMRDARREQELSFKAYSAEIGKRRECVKNGAPIPRLSELVGVFRAVLFTPEQLAIVKAGPAERRGFLDAAICQLRPAYLAALSRHNKILTQRNALLKQLAEGEGDAALLEVCSEQLAREAAFIYVTRADYVERLSAHVARFFGELGSLSERREVPELSLQTSLKTEERLTEAEAFERYLARLTAHASREIAAGVTLYGSHKDDVLIRLDGVEARAFASQGQQRSLALALKLGEGEISCELTGEQPVFLFDDVLSELDPVRQEFLLSRLGSRQVIMTGCFPPSVSCGAYTTLQVAGGAFG